MRFGKAQTRDANHQFFLRAAYTLELHISNDTAVHSVKEDGGSEENVCQRLFWAYRSHMVTLTAEVERANTDSFSATDVIEMDSSRFGRRKGSSGGRVHTKRLQNNSLAIQQFFRKSRKQTRDQRRSHTSRAAAFAEKRSDHSRRCQGLGCCSRRQGALVKRASHGRKIYTPSA